MAAQNISSEIIFSYPDSRFCILLFGFQQSNSIVAVNVKIKNWSFGDEVKTSAEPYYYRADTEVSGNSFLESHLSLSM